MKTNKEIRKNARNTVKNNYFILVFVSIIMMVVAGSYTTTLSGLRNLTDRFSGNNLRAQQAIENSISNSNADVTTEILTLIFKTSDVDKIKFKASVTGGLFRTIFDGVTKAERILFVITQYIIDIFVSTNNTIVLGIIIILVGILYKVFFAKPLKVGQSRIFLESRLYDKTPMRRLTDIIRQDYINIVKTIFLMDMYQFLWNFTIIGGIIKLYSYRLVPMIMAENPNIKPKEAIRLSMKMMKGNKRKLLKLDLSFLFYEILDIATFGILGVLIFNPYYTAALTEFYCSVREDYIKDKKPMFELLNDKKLVENNSGLHCYPGVTKKEMKRADEIFNYYQKYTLTSLILMFFFFSFTGWIWEVLIYLFKDGRFVNRGTLNGPWLPIYGFGCVLVLFLLFLPKKYKKITDNPILTFFIVMLICGTIEYFTSLYLELVYEMRWWDYTGYFLNINGRVCLEGLIFFGIGGCGCLYIIAPQIQYVISKVPKKVREVLSVLLVIMILIDYAYSSVYPNIGAGITDDNIRNNAQTTIVKEAE